MKSFLKAEKAVAAIEFAIIAPLFFLLLIGIIEFGLTVFMQSSLDTGLRAYARSTQTHNSLYDTSGNATLGTDSHLNDYLYDYTGGIFDPTKTKLITRIYSDLEGTSTSGDNIKTDAALLQSTGADGFFSKYNTSNPLTPECASCAASPSGTLSNQYVLYAIQYQWGGITQLMHPFIPTYLYSFTIVKTEAY